MEISVKAFLPFALCCSLVAVPAVADSLDADIVFWQSIQNSADPAEYDAYLQTFPDGKFAALARIRAERPVQGAQPALSDWQPAVVQPAETAVVEPPQTTVTPTVEAVAVRRSQPVAHSAQLPVVTIRPRDMANSSAESIGNVATTWQLAPSPFRTFGTRVGAIEQVAEAEPARATVAAPPGRSATGVPTPGQPLLIRPQFD